jgi:hypothetical protein
MNPLLISSCPHCAHCFGDELELLDNNTEHDMQCERCREPFVLLIRECASCAVETSFSWRYSGQSRDLAQLCCKQCGNAIGGDALNCGKGSEDGAPLGF